MLLTCSPTGARLKNLLLKLEGFVVGKDGKRSTWGKVLRVTYLSMAGAFIGSAIFAFTELGTTKIITIISSDPDNVPSSTRTTSVRVRRSENSGTTVSTTPSIQDGTLHKEKNRIKEIPGKGTSSPKRSGRGNSEQNSRGRSEESPGHLRNTTTTNSDTPSPGLGGPIEVPTTSGVVVPTTGTTPPTTIPPTTT